MRNRLACTVAICVLASCAEAPKNEAAIPIGDEGPPELSHQGLPYDSVTSRVLSRDDKLGQPFSIAVVGDYLVVTDFSGRPFVHIISRSDTSAAIRSFGKEGQGPGEFVGVPVVVPQTIDSSKAWLFDMRRRRLTRLDVERIYGQTTEAPAMLDVEAPSRGILRIVALQGGQLLTVTFTTDFATGRGALLAWTMFDSAGKNPRELGPFLINDDRLGPAQLGEFYQPRLCTAAGVERVGIAYLYAGRIDIVDLEGRNPARASVPRPFRPYVLTPGTDPKYPEPVPNHPLGRFGYVDCAASKANMYALFSGRRRQEFGAMGGANSGFVHVFDWSGALARIIKLDHLARGLAVDAGGTTLYTVGEDAADARPTIRATAIARR